MSNNQPKRKLPARPSIKFLKKQAKRLLRQARRHEPGALARLQRTGTRSEPRLADAQRALAREHGYPSWRKMIAAIDRLRLDGAMDEARLLARRYAASIGCSPHAIRALGRSTTPMELVDELAPLCHRDDARSLAMLEDPRARLDLLRDALKRMIDGQWDLETTPGAAFAPADALAELVVVAEREPAGLLGRRFPLRPTTTTVGRALRCDVCLPVASVSRRHCTLQGDRDAFAVHDEGSTNGVFVGDGETRVKGARLRDRDRLRIGELTLELRMRERDPAPAHVRP